MSPRDHAAALDEIARRAMVKYGLEPDWPDEARAELEQMSPAPLASGRDLRSLPWSSIDNDESRDLDQLEVCIEGPEPRVLVAIADVDALVHRGTALDAHARANTTSVYTPARIFPMLPPELSTDRTSLNEHADRDAVVVDMTIGPDGVISRSEVYQARVRNCARLTYDGVAAWLDGTGPAPAPLEAVPELPAQVRLQDRLASRLRARRQEQGALDFDRTELRPIVTDGVVTGLYTQEPNRARDLIESVMVAANGVTASFLSGRGYPSIRRVVRAPERWSRIVDLAAQHGRALPGAPDARALESFLQAERASQPGEFADLSL